MFKEADVDRLATADLLEGLHRLEESPWAEFGKAGKPMSARHLADLLRPFGIGPTTKRLPDGDRLKGYEKASFEDAVKRYVTPFPDSIRDTVTTPVTVADSTLFDAVTNPPRHGTENPEKPNNDGQCHGVTAQNPKKRDGGRWGDGIPLPAEPPPTPEEEDDDGELWPAADIEQEAN